MRQKDMIALMFALGIAVLTTLVARALFYTAPAAPEPTTQAPQQKLDKDMTEVLVAANNLILGNSISAAHITWQRWPKKSVLEAYIVRNDEEEDQYQKIIGSLIKRSINVGEPITVNDIIKKGDHSFLSAIVRPGMRAISLPLGSNAAGGALLSPGDMVDVISAITNSPGTTPTDNFSGKTLAENVRILAIDQRLDDNKGIPGGDNHPKFITLEVTPSQAEILAMALKLGELTYSLRGIQINSEPTNAVVSGEKATINELKQQLKNQIQAQAKTSTPPKQTSHIVRIVRGDTRTQVTFKGDQVEETVESRGSSQSGSMPANASMTALAGATR